MPRRAIQAHSNARGLPYLLHFTRASNLPTVLQHGLYPIGRAREVGLVPQINDQLRLDGHKDSNSVSIGFPNSQMLYKYRMAEPLVDWVILVLHPSILWVKDCAFCKHNAADGRISCCPLPELMTPESLLGMFEEIDGCLPRAEQRLKTSDPTDVQAEVLVFDVIEPQYIVGVIYEKALVRDAHAHLLSDRKPYVHSNNKGMFANRKYARTWG
ncbi:DarT ssDNA thymidine ADP-ribosyltransferase family protein [Pseudomonas sp. CCI3.2]|uniref:DarT ssDNA thymidine ADP-ribosyltransferase family protein n=1 Tax=unclassified Pseudomonas TaxID=196821 RepID=UPI002AC9499C|nr:MULTISPECIES: DarT ssDNA thymidine ADP-ribosyltransferase family protein [unclassified Pseudomonas]MEB0079402.1 DarT ssDNA thymidine ADP-ribosyltransferase family protein [Pseudomonas sp. MH10out]MEB0103756.1 DarT ssDNA thymidine ADP-ribosyltransferase family protein [Pseudomonas sp. CCI3.2]MEB0132399.1 DarT ssDNA thymidine ADP-ribosyltransferase family protein [Pseudomonas sp. CCI2.4]MEB0159681.1 DarT ssDNA thymidine ADP-ribosyltransferase family protein [Pseudomonas sp. AH2 (2023)]MEB0169